MPEGSVGSVFLDFVVRDTIDKQVQNLATKAQTAIQKSFSNIEDSINTSVQKTIARTSEVAASAATSAGKAAESAANAAEKAVQSAASSAADCGQRVEASIDKSFNRAVALAQAKVNELETSLARVTEKLRAAMKNDDDSTAKKLGDKQMEIYDKLAAARERLAIEVQTAAQKQLAVEKAAAQQAVAPVQNMAEEASSAAESSSQAVENAAKGPLQRIAEKICKFGDAIANGPARALGLLAEEANQAADSVEDQSEDAQESEEEQSSAFAKIKSAASRAFSAVKSIGTKAFETAGRAAKGFRNVASKAFSGAKTIASGFGKAISSIKNKFSSAGKSAGGFGRRLKGLASRAFVFNIISSGFRSVSSSLQTALTSSDSMQNALANLKGTAATAAAPIIELLTPALTALTNAAATAFSYLSKLISSLTGKSISAMTSAAKKMQSTADTAKKAAKSVAGFDEIQKLDSGDSSSSDGDSGAYNYDFQGQSSFLDSVMESVKAGNWNDVGALVAQKLNDSLESIKWPDIQAKVKSWVSGVAQTINGFVGTLDFSTVGSTISGAINTILTGINTFFQDVDWTGLGTGIGTGLSNMFSTLDWSGVGIFLTNGIRSLLEGLHGFVTSFDFSAFGSNLATATMAAINNVDWVQGAKDLGQAAIGLFETLTAWITDMDWQQIGNTIADSVAAVDWNGLVSSLVEGIGAACAGLTELIWGLIEDAWAGVVKWWEEVAYEDGQFTMEGLLKGIGDIFVNIGTWITENIFDPFINGFKNAFDIHSPSGEMESMGDFLIQGLFQGISDAWTSITTFFTDAFDSVKGTITEIWEDGILPAIKGPINSIISFINEMISGICEGINTIIRAMNKLKWDIPDWVPLLGGKTFGFNLKTITAPQIPMLANGGVITQPTLAMMGEYSGARNNPEIAAPQSLIEQTLANAMQGYSGDMIQRLDEVVEVLKDILEAVLGIEIGDSVIGQAVDRYKRSRAIINGGVW